jgi:CCR4-NOT transcription complex subunit 7/8
MDTEFPGNVYPLQNFTNNFYYKFIKLNVDKLNLIQLGITLFNENGEMLPEGSCWQFNLKFNINSDVHSGESISLLSNSGIDFMTLKKKRYSL